MALAGAINAALARWRKAGVRTAYQRRIKYFGMAYGMFAAR
jgi:hypothetical protein